MAMRPDGRRITEGDRLKDLSAEQLNAVIDVARAALDAQAIGPGVVSDTSGGVMSILFQGERKGFFARIDAEGTGTTAPDKYGYYAWTEIEMTPGGSFESITDRLPRRGALTGSDADPARDLFFKSAVPVGLPVYMMPMTTSVGGGKANWIFLTPDLVQVVRFGSGPRSPWGDYDGYVQRFNGTDYSDAEQIWITTP